MKGKTKLRDSAYGKRPSGAGPSEGFGVTLTPVDPELKAHTKKFGNRNRHASSSVKDPSTR